MGYVLRLFRVCREILRLRQHPPRHCHQDLPFGPQQQPEQHADDRESDGAAAHALVAGELARATGVFVEPAAAAAFAGFARMCESGVIKPDERVLLMLTGNGLKDIQAPARMATESIRVGTNLSETTEALIAAGFRMPNP